MSNLDLWSLMSTPGDQDLGPQPQQKSCVSPVLDSLPHCISGLSLAGVPQQTGFTDLARLRSVTSAFVWSHLCLVVQMILSPPNPRPSPDPAGNCSSLPYIPDRKTDECLRWAYFLRKTSQMPWSNKYAASGLFVKTHGEYAVWWELL